jgi:hypothetical protein
VVDPAASDDLSGGIALSSNKANEVLDDARMRRWLRLAVSGVVVIVIAGLGWLLYLTVCAMLKDLAFVSVPAVSFATALVVAVSGLTIALLHAIFADRGTEPAHDDVSDRPGITTPGIEALKALHGMLETIIKGPNGKS